MTWRVADVRRVMDDWAPPEWACGWDRVGLQIGDPDREVSTVAVCLTVCGDTVAQARAAGAGMIVCHHPVIWKPLGALRMDCAETRLCVEMAASGMACFAAHTNLDAAPGGVNAALAAALGLRGVKPLFPAAEAEQVKLVTFVPASHLEAVRRAVSAAGAGVIGDYTECSFSTPGTGTFLPGAGASPYSGEKGRVNEEPESRFETLAPKHRLGAVLRALFGSHPYEEPAYDVVPLVNTDARAGMGAVGDLPEPVAAADFAGHVSCALGVRVRVVGGGGTGTVRRVAVMGGSGGGEVSRIPADADAYVTGDVKYHDALAALERGLLVVDAGHHGTERCVLPVVAERLRRELPGLHAAVLEEPDPFTLPPCGPGRV